jgi:soluble lytic murein transglycosylase-like protein
MVASLLPGPRRPIASALLCAGVLALPLPCAALVECTDAWGQRYLLSNPPTGASGLRCEARSADAGTTAAAPRPQPVDHATPAGHRGLELLTDNNMSLRGGLRLVEIPSVSRALAPRAASLQPLIDNVARLYAHEPQLLNALIHVESRFNPDAVSPKGAIGLMQVMPATAERMGLRDPTRALFDPASNLHAGARYLRLLLDMFAGQIELAIAAYNAGEGAVIKYGRRIPPYPETEAYVRQVMELYRRPAGS